MQKVLLLCLILNQTPRSDAKVNTALSLPIVFLSDTVWDNTVNMVRLQNQLAGLVRKRLRGRGQATRGARGMLMA